MKTSIFLAGLLLFSNLLAGCASTAASQAAADEPPIPAPPVAGKLVWVDDPSNYTLTDGRIRFLENGKVRTLEYPQCAFPSWDPSGRIWEFQTGPERVVLAGSGRITLPKGCPGTSALSPSQKQFAAVSADGLALELSDSTTGQVSKRIPIFETRPADDEFPEILYLPWWSPRGDEIAYTIRRTLYRSELWVCRTDGTGAVRVNTGLDEGWGAAWSPDGSRLAFYAAGGIWVVESGGAGLRKLTPDSAFAAFPTWSPDGTQVAFQNNSAENGPDIWLVEADGTQPRLLIGGRGFQGHPAWTAP